MMSSIRLASASHLLVNKVGLSSMPRLFLSSAAASSASSPSSVDAAIEKARQLFAEYRETQ